VDIFPANPFAQRSGWRWSRSQTIEMAFSPYLARKPAGGLSDRPIANTLL
jgi:hypothetical protein